MSLARSRILPAEGSALTQELWREELVQPANPPAGCSAARELRQLLLPLISPSPSLPSMFCSAWRYTPRLVWASVPRTDPKPGSSNKAFLITLTQKGRCDGDDAPACCPS